MTPDSAPPPDGPRRTVFVVDDDAALVESLVDVLVDEGYHADGFTDPAQALACLRDGARPSVLLLDMLMPGMNGEQFLVALAEAEVRVPVLLLSGLTETGIEAHRVAAVLPKPCDLDRLLAELSRVAGAGR